MKRLVQAVLLVCLVVLMLGAARGQSAATRNSASAAAGVANVSGRWSGSFDTVKPNGEIEPDSAVFVLTQDGSKLSGTAGPSESQMETITDGVASGDDVRFSLDVKGVTVKFALRREGDRMRGEVTGFPGLEPGAQVKVEVVREAAGADAPATATTGELYAKVAALDKKLFDAYNTCDLETMGAMVEDGLEFYHDKTGLMVGKQPFIEAIKQNICGKTQRTLVASSLEVYPLKDYGAVEIGVHRFTHPGQTGLDEGEAKFVTVWHYKDGTWKISRAISFDHHADKAR